MLLLIKLLLKNIAKLWRRKWFPRRQQRLEKCLTINRTTTTSIKFTKQTKCICIKIVSVKCKLISKFINKIIFAFTRRRPLAYSSYYIIAYIIFRINKIGTLKEVNDLEGIEDNFRVVRDWFQQPEGIFFIQIY